LPTQAASDWTTLVSSQAVTAIVSAIVAAAVYYFLEGRKFRREQRVNDVKERLDRFYSPMIFHFENMKSWGAAWGKDTYVFAGETLGRKIDDMNDLMRSGLRFVSPKVEKLWYEWQPYAVAAVERRRGNDFYPHLSEAEFVNRSRVLHEALNLDRAELSKQYHNAIGENR